MKFYQAYNMRFALRKYRVSFKILWSGINHIRWKSNEVPTVSKKSRTFTQFYEEYFGSQWPEIFQGLKQNTQCCALINKYNNEMPQTQMTLESEGARILQFCEKKVNDINLLCYKKDSERLLQPVHNYAGSSNYYLMDASSVLPVIALDIESHHHVLDLCAAPGGKSYAILQLLSPNGMLVANEPNLRRRKRLHKVISGCVPPGSANARHVRICGFDGVKIGNVETDLYDRVLVDVPCSADRHIVLNNFINPSWSLAKSKRNSNLQHKLLKAALSAVVPGGIVVYSTCAISTHENDAVIERLLSSSDEFLEIRDTLGRINVEEFAIYGHTKYGVLILPTVQKNWGPLYFCKLQKLNKQ